MHSVIILEIWIHILAYDSPYVLYTAYYIFNNKVNSTGVVYKRDIKIIQIKEIGKLIQVFISNK